MLLNSTVRGHRIRLFALHYKVVSFKRTRIRLISIIHYFRFLKVVHRIISFKNLVF